VHSFAAPLNEVMFVNTKVPVENRILRLEEAVALIQRECELALEKPDVVFTTVCRIATLTRRALDAETVRRATA